MGILEGSSILDRARHLYAQNGISVLDSKRFRKPTEHEFFGYI